VKHAPESRLVILSRVLRIATVRQGRSGRLAGDVRSNPSIGALGMLTDMYAAGENEVRIGQAPIILAQ
jgi:hypothetical protein